MTDIFLLINITSFKDKNGDIYWTICDNAYFYPAMELACGKVSYLPELKYWYTANTGFNDVLTDRQEEYREVFEHIRDSQKPY